MISIIIFLNWLLLIYIWIFRVMVRFYFGLIISFKIMGGASRLSSIVCYPLWNIEKIDLAWNSMKIDLAWNSKICVLFKNAKISNPLVEFLYPTRTKSVRQLSQTPVCIRIKLTYICNSKSLNLNNQSTLNTTPNNIVVKLTCVFI